MNKTLYQFELETLDFIFLHVSILISISLLPTYCNEYRDLKIWHFFFLLQFFYSYFIDI
jgi:hypothetical protein